MPRTHDQGRAVCPWSRKQRETADQTLKRYVFQRGCDDELAADAPGGVTYLWTSVQICFAGSCRIEVTSWPTQTRTVVRSVAHAYSEHILSANCAPSYLGDDRACQVVPAQISRRPALLEHEIHLGGITGLFS